MAKPVTNMAASVRARLLTYAKANNLSFEQTLTNFVLQRLLYRLSASRHVDRFVLKGAMLLTSWFDDPLRPTRDIDFLGYGDPAPEVMTALFAEIMSTAVEDDGVIFQPDKIRVEAIREDVEYGGVRLKTVAFVGAATVPVTIDIGFGDATTPEPETFDYPVLLEFPAPRLKGYARETVIAEKFQAMVALGMANTRIKDFYDVRALARGFDYDTTRLAAAVRATFDRRDTEIPSEPPVALTEAFANDAAKTVLWRRFTEDLGEQEDFPTAIAALNAFLMPVALGARALPESRQETKPEAYVPRTETS